MATIKNISIEQGASFSLAIIVSDIAGAPLVLSNYIARSAMKKSYGSLTSIPLTTVITNPTQGEVTISLTPTQTSAIKSGRYVYDIEVSNVTGYIGSTGYLGSQGINLDVIRIVEGIVTVKPEVS